ncbi:MAG: MATE family efflux transporter [Clostridium sp.]|nr:MATE family efflux transporter [Clostridium sp.]
MNAIAKERNAGKKGKQGNGITEGVIWKQLLIFFFPILFGTFFQQLYNTVDAVIVGRFVGKEALAAVGGSTGTLINLLVGFFVGLSSGATVIISQFYGGGREKRVSEAVHTAIAFSLACGVGLMVIGIAASPIALRAMGTPEDIMQYSLSYIRIYFLGIIPNLVYNMGAGILRAIGDSKRPLYYLMASCFTNIVLDLVLVVWLRLDVRGAAIATIVSQLVSAVLVVLQLLRTKDSYRLVIRKIRLNLFMVMRIVRIGLPAGLQSVMYSASNIIIQSSVNSLGTDTVAAWTAYSKIDSVYWMIISALGISITTFVGQNYGAGKLDRVKRGIYVCLGLSFLITAILSAVLYLGGGYIYLMFTADAAVIAKGMEILHFLVPAFATYVCIEVLSGALRGTGDCWIPMIMTAVGVCALRVLWILVAVPLKPDILTVVFSYPLTWSITSILFLVYFYCFSSLKKFNVPLPRLRRRRKHAGTV